MPPCRWAYPSLVLAKLVASRCGQRVPLEEVPCLAGRVNVEATLAAEKDRTQRRTPPAVFAAGDSAERGVGLAAAPGLALDRPELISRAGCLEAAFFVGVVES